MQILVIGSKIEKINIISKESESKNGIGIEDVSKREVKCGKTTESILSKESAKGCAGTAVMEIDVSNSANRRAQKGNQSIEKLNRAWYVINYQKSSKRK